MAKTVAEASGNGSVRKVALSGELGILDMVLKIGLYFVHERLWNHIAFGRSKRPEYEI